MDVYPATDCCGFYAIEGFSYDTYGHDKFNVREVMNNFITKEGLNVAYLNSKRGKLVQAILNSAQLEAYEKQLDILGFRRVSVFVNTTFNTLYVYHLFTADYIEAGHYSA